MSASTGDFCGTSGTDLGCLPNRVSRIKDPANVPATYFALALLLLLRDDIQRVCRKDWLYWLSRLQRLDGSFGQTLGDSGTIDSGTHTRFAYTALTIRHILSGAVPIRIQAVRDIDLNKLANHIRQLKRMLADTPINPVMKLMVASRSALSVYYT